MKIASRSVGLTYDDLRRLPDDGMRHELINGEHYVTPAPSFKHQGVLGNLYYEVRRYLDDHPVGHAYVAPADVVFSPIDCVEPDMLYLSLEREQRQLNEQYLAGSPDLAVEILSPSTKRVDEGAKLRLYERFGVSEYWIIDPKGEMVRIYRLEDGRLQLCEELSPGEGTSVRHLSTPLLPGLEIPLAKIFA